MQADGYPLPVYNGKLIDQALVKKCSPKLLPSNLAGIVRSDDKFVQCVTGEGGNKLGSEIRKRLVRALARAVVLSTTITGFLLLMPFLNGMTLGVTFGMVAGIMVFISLDELLPTAHEYGKHHLAIYGLVAGMAVMAVSLLLFASV